MRRALPAALLLAAASGSYPAAAQQPLPPDTGPLSLQPRSAEAGKPLVPGLYSSGESGPGDRTGCAAALGCRVQLLGAIEKNGAVMLRGKAFTW
jgi:hypothetical protein